MEQNSYRAIFFDLDGTLLPIELEVFMRRYMGALVGFVSSHGLDTEAFTKALLFGVSTMSNNEGGRSNADVFWDVFYGMVEKGRETWAPLFEQFYEHEFNAIGSDIVPNPAVAESVKTLRQKGYPLVCATMPMFPLAAVEWRIGWAGLKPDAFSRITHFENSTVSKPNPAYYKEILEATGLLPQDALMVGNDTGDDLACLEIGMDAYLVTDYLIDESGFDLSTLKHGTFEDFSDWAKTLPPCKNPATGIKTGLVSP